MTDSGRQVAVQRLKAKRDFRMHLGAYVIVNLMLVGIWAFSGAGAFWPGWVILFWGVGLAFNGWWAFFGQPILDSEIDREMGKGG